MIARFLCMLVVAGGCGRFGFDASASGDGGAIDGSDTVDSLALPTRIDVQPRWATPAGGPIIVTFLDESSAADATITVAGSPCTVISTSANLFKCQAPAHAAGVVPLTARAGGTDESIAFSYLALGPALVGGTGDDASSGIAIDRAGNTYVVGGTLGSFDQPNAGDWDALIVKFDSAGQLAWTRQFGSPGYDYLRDVTVGADDTISVIGYTTGSLNGPNAGSNDVVVARYRPDGTRAWLTQFGSAGDDQAWDLAVDTAGDTVVAVRTSGDLGTPQGSFDAGVARLDPAGAIAWIRTFGSAASDIGHSITITPDGIAFLVGYTAGTVESGVPNQGMEDLFVARYEPDGTRSWIHQRGTAGNERAQDATIDDQGDVWVVGSTTGGLDGQTALGGIDIFVEHWSPAGTLILTRLYGGAGDQNSFAINVAPGGGPVFVGGNTNTGFDGEPGFGTTDGCAISLARDGTRRWSRIVGTTGYDAISGCTISPAFAGLYFCSVITAGALGGVPNQGIEDLGFVRYDLDGTAY